MNTVVQLHGPYNRRTGYTNVAIGAVVILHDKKEVYLNTGYQWQEMTYVYLRHGTDWLYNLIKKTDLNRAFWLFDETCKMFNNPFWTEAPAKDNAMWHDWQRAVERDYVVTRWLYFKEPETVSKKRKLTDPAEYLNLTNFGKY